jgi:hypothetical protein
MNEYLPSTYDELLECCNVVVLGLYNAFVDDKINMKEKEGTIIEGYRILLGRNIRYAPKEDHDFCVKVYLLEKKYYERAREFIHENIDTWMRKWEKYFILAPKKSFYYFRRETDDYEAKCGISHITSLLTEKPQQGVKGKSKPAKSMSQSNKKPYRSETATSRKPPQITQAPTPTIRQSENRIKPKPQYPSNPEPKDKQSMANYLRKHLNKYTSEGDHFTWKSKIEKDGMYRLEMLQYFPDIRAWKPVEWSYSNSVAVIQLRDSKYIRYPKLVVPVGFSVNSPQVGEWYTIEGRGSEMKIVNMASAKFVEGVGAFVLGKKKGRISLYDNE